MPVGDVYVCHPVDRDAVRLVELSANSGAAVAGVAGLARAGTGGDDAGPHIDPPDAVVEGVREIEIASSVEADIERPVQNGSVGRPAIPGKAPFAGPDRCRDDPGLTWHGWPFSIEESDLSIGFRAGDRRCKLPGIARTSDTNVFPAHLDPPLISGCGTSRGNVARSGGGRSPRYRFAGRAIADRLAQYRRSAFCSHRYPDGEAR